MPQSNTFLKLFSHLQDIDIEMSDETAEVRYYTNETDDCITAFIRFGKVDVGGEYAPTHYKISNESAEVQAIADFNGNQINLNQRQIDDIQQDFVDYCHDNDFFAYCDTYNPFKTSGMTIHDFI